MVLKKILSQPPHPEPESAGYQGYPENPQHSAGQLPHEGQPYGMMGHDALGQVPVGYEYPQQQPVYTHPQDRRAYPQVPSQPSQQYGYDPSLPGSAGGQQAYQAAPAPETPQAPKPQKKKSFFSKSRTRQKSADRDESSQDQQWLPSTKSSAVNRVGTRLISVGIYGAIALGLGLGGMSYLALEDINARAAQQKPVAATSLDMTDTSAQAQAVGYVQAWLSATGSDHAALDQYAQVTVNSQEPTEYRNLRQAGFTKNGDLISVRVTGETKTVQEQEGGKRVEVWTPRWWQVVLRVDGSGGISVVGLPTPISAPASASGNLNLGYSKPVNSTEASATVNEFLTAYLTGVGEVSRYTTPGSSILPVTPAPYEQVSVQEIRSDVDLTDKTIRKNGAKAHLSVVARTSSGKSAQTTTYFLTVKARDGRWEIESIDQIPVKQQSEGDKK